MSAPPLKVAVTGGAGSGKSTVCRHFETLGARVIDLDRIAREAVQPGSPVLSAILGEFGPGMLTADGHLDRRRMRKRIVRDASARRWLESVVHPEVLRQMRSRFEAAGREAVAIVVAEVPLLFEAGLESDFDVIVTVTAPETTRVDRLVLRDAVAPDQARALVGIQMSDSEKTARSDVVISNTGTAEDLLQSATRLFDELLKKSRKRGKSA